MRLLLSIVLALYAVPALAAEHRVVMLETRPGVMLSLYYLKHDGAKATVVLLPGGNGILGLDDGDPTSKDFLVRSREYFAAKGFNVAIPDKPSNEEYLDFNFRVSSRHIDDLKKITTFLKEDTHLPIWLIGTSRGTVSATAAAISFGNEALAGIVLTSSVTASNKPGAVPFQKLESIRIPVLVFHNKKDECDICKPADVPLIMNGLKNSVVKKAILVNGGEGPTGSVCGSTHLHGYIGMEKEAVEIISNWIHNPES